MRVCVFACMRACMSESDKASACDWASVGTWMTMRALTSYITTQ